MKKHFLLACLLMAMGGVCPDVVNAQCGDNGDGTFSNPVFWADVPLRNLLLFQAFLPLLL